ncbi:MAG: hypothetical protein RLO09_16380, partial [Cyclobacteriaceae bacterium]
GRAHTFCLDRNDGPAESIRVHGGQVRGGKEIKWFPAGTVYKFLKFRLFNTRSTVIAMFFKLEKVKKQKQSSI